MYKKNGLIMPDGAFVPKKAIWRYYADKIIVVIKDLI